MTRRKATRALLGLVALGIFGGAIALTWHFLKGGFVGGMPVDAVFSAPGVGQQLPIGGDVKVRGVLVGRIDDLELNDDGNPVVKMLLDRDLDLPADVTAEIRSKTVFGQKWVELIPPESSSSDEVLHEGSVIPDANTKEPLELERALQLGHDLLSTIPLQDLSDLLQALADGFGGQESDARRAIDRGLVALRAVNSRSDRLDLGLKQLRDFAAWLDDNDTDLLSLMESLDAANRALVGAAPEFESSLDSVPVFLDDLARFQEATEDDLGRLVEQGATVAEIVAARSDQLVDIVVQLRAATTVINSGLEQPCGGLFEDDMTCVQVYELPGLESRGLYGANGGPLADDPGDPLARLPSERTFRSLLSAYTESPVPSDLARLLYAPVAESLAELIGGAE
ncbi:MAG: MlaD family protein [Actinomycetota bacterium]